MSILINEVFPNPSTGQEWVEIIILDDEDNLQATDLLGYTLSDDYHVIYNFDGEENCFEQFLLILVSGLNNPGDQVILKDFAGNVIDEMSYSSSQKDQSWSRDATGQFFLGPASPLANNPPMSTSPSPTSTPSPDPTSTPSVAPSITPSIAPNSAVPADSALEPTLAGIHDQAANLADSQLFDPTAALSNYQHLAQWQLSVEKHATQSSQSRLQFLGQKIATRAVKDVIMGSCLIMIAAILFSYDQKQTPPQAKL